MSVEDIIKIIDKDALNIMLKNQKLELEIESNIESNNVKNNSSVNWKQMRTINETIWKIYTFANPLTPAWEKITENCNKKTDQNEKDKCFAIFGIIFTTFVIFLFISKLVEQHDKKDNNSKLNKTEIINTFIESALIRVTTESMRNEIELFKTLVIKSFKKLENNRLVDEAMKTAGDL